MKINDHKIDYLNKEALELVELLTIIKHEPEPEPSQETHKGSLGEQESIITLHNVTNFIQRQGYQIRQFIGNKSIGFDEENGKRFQMLVSNIHKEKEINCVVSRDFIDSKVWMWLAKSKSKETIQSDLLTYLQLEIQSSIKQFRIYFPVVYLSIEIPFQIGDVEFGFFTSRYFDKYIHEHNKLKPNEPNIYIDMKRDYQGMVYVAVTVMAELGKAKEIALQKCSFSMDILKICSNTLDYPFVEMVFDIDNRLNKNPQSEILVESQNFTDGLIRNLRRPSVPYSLDKVQFQYIKERHLDVFHNFILQLSSDPSELQRLISQGIRQFANALSNSNLFRRIAELYTILESLLLLNEDSPIIDTVSKYASRLVAKEREARKIVIKLLREMYNVRSAWIHHAKERKFQMDDLKKLQRIVHTILINLIVKTRTHSTKRSLLEEIDDAILGAY